jgi:SsrA-binding protein
MPTLAYNKRAGFDYEILEKYEAGLSLLGFEVKAIKTGHISLKESFVTSRGQELFLTNANVPLYKQAGNIKNYEPTRPRKLLLKRKEIAYLIGKSRMQGLTLIPLRVYTKKRLLKLEFSVGKGKKQFDKRDKIRKREAEIKMRRHFKF